MKRILCFLLLFGCCTAAFAQPNPNVNVRSGMTRHGVTSSYRWHGGSSGRGTWGMQQTGSVQYGGVQVYGTAQDGYIYVIGSGTYYPYVRTAVPVVPYTGPNRLFSPSPMASPTPSRRFYSNRRY